MIIGVGCADIGLGNGPDRLARLPKGKPESPNLVSVLDFSFAISSLSIFVSPPLTIFFFSVDFVVVVGGCDLGLRSLFALAFGFGGPLPPLTG